MTAEDFDHSLKILITPSTWKPALWYPLLENSPILCLHSVTKHVHDYAVIKIFQGLHLGGHIVMMGDSSDCFFCLFFFCVPQLYLWGSPLLGEIFAYVTVFFFFNPTIKVVTFRLRGWCVLGVFLLRAFTRLGHERQDLLSPCDEMHVCTD